MAADAVAVARFQFQFNKLRGFLAERALEHAVRTGDVVRDSRGDYGGTGGQQNERPSDAWKVHMRSVMQRRTLLAFAPCLAGAPQGLSEQAATARPI